MGTCHSMDLYLVRHGLTLWNVQKKYLGHTDIGLLKSEKSQLEELSVELSKRPFDYIFSSDLKRCQETIEYLDPRGSIQLEPRLREMDFGEWEGKTYNELKHDIRYTEWLDNWEELAPSNGETGLQFKARINQFLTALEKEILDKGVQKKDHIEKDEKPWAEDVSSPKVLIVTHGGVIRHILSLFIPKRSFWQWKVTHGSGYILSLVWQEEGWQCNSWSEVPTQGKERLFGKR
jgi:alpha-ribazole phosphatase